MDQISLSRTNFIGALLIYLQTYASLPLIYSKCGISGIIKDRVAKHIGILMVKLVGFMAGKTE